jgi:hypothetical protein
MKGLTMVRFFLTMILHLPEPAPISVDRHGITGGGESGTAW